MLISVPEPSISVGKGRPMTPDDLRQWRKEQGKTQRQAADALGYGLTQYGAMERASSISVLPISVALACAALTAGIPPYPNKPPAE